MGAARSIRLKTAVLAMILIAAAPSLAGTSEETAFRAE